MHGKLKSDAKKGKKASLRKISLKKLLIIAYILVPALVMSVGFAAWMITSPLVGNNALGGFVADDVINTSACIEVSEVKQFQMYYTGFVDENGAISNTADVKVKTNIDFIQCIKEAKLETPAADTATLYLEYTLSYLSGNDETLAFYTVKPTISATSTVSDNTEMAQTMGGYTVTVRQQTKFEATSSSTIVTYELVLPKALISAVNTLETAPVFNADIYFNFTFDFSKTPAPSTLPTAWAALGNDALGKVYNQLYNRFNDNEQFLIDVRLSDVNPNASQA